MQMTEKKPETVKKPVRQRVGKQRTKMAYLRANDLIKNKIHIAMVEKATYIDGVGAAPILRRIAMELKMTETQLHLFILANHLRWMTKHDADIWGYNKDVFYQALRKFRRAGLIQSFNPHANCAKSVVSVKGRALFATFQKKYHALVVEFYKKYEQDNPARYFKPVIK